MDTPPVWLMSIKIEVNFSSRIFPAEVIQGDLTIRFGVVDQLRGGMYPPRMRTTHASGGFHGLIPTFNSPKADRAGAMRTSREWTSPRAAGAARNKFRP